MSQRNDGRLSSHESRPGILPRRHLWHLLAMAAAVGLAWLPVEPAVAQTHHTSSPATASQASSGGQTVLGDVVPFGDGTARSWVHLDSEGKPTALGITLTEAALQGLPADVTPGMIWVVEYLLKVPSGINGLPFDHVGVNWNPRGHPPAEIYGAAHFDIHFYTISPERRSKITARGPDVEMCQKPPAEGHLPEGYVFAPDSQEPGMGGHWADPTSHEFHGQAFTSTFIYGSHNGEIIFYEPMITKAYLESKPDATMPLKVPKVYAKSGYYPTSYSIRYDESRKEYTVALEGLTLRQATASR